MSNGYQPPAVTAIISTHNRREELQITLTGLRQLGYPGLQCIVTDNASEDGTEEQVRRDFPEIKFLPHSDNLPLRGYNLGFDVVRTPYVLVLDDDSCPRPGAIERMVAILEDNPFAGAVAANIVGRDGKSEWGAEGNLDRSTDWFNLIGCGFLIRNRVLLQAGGYDEHFGLYYNDLELALRILAFGHRIVYDREAIIEHRQVRTTVSPLKYRLMLRNFPLLLRSHFAFRQRLDLALGHALIALRQAVKDHRLCSALRGLAEAWRTSSNRPFLPAPAAAPAIRLFVQRYSFLRLLYTRSIPAGSAAQKSSVPFVSPIPRRRTAKARHSPIPHHEKVRLQNLPPTTRGNTHHTVNRWSSDADDDAVWCRWYTSPWNHYQQYLSRHSNLSCRERHARFQKVSQWTYRPVISILTPVYKTQPEHLKECLLSVERQIYPHWQLCIIDDGSGRSDIRQILEDFAARHPGRVKLLIRDENRGIALTSQEALELATGDFVALLDHDDRLAPEALWEVVARLNLCPDLDWIYGDYDKISPDGQRYFYYFKPGWSPELLLSYCYILHLCVIRHRLVQQVGGFRREFEGAQDFDLFLRLAEQTDRVAHIPRILYSWRQSPESTSQNPDSKPYSYEAGRRAIAAALQRRGEAAICETLTGDDIWAGVYRIQRPAFQPDVDLVILPSKGERPPAKTDEWIALQTGVHIDQRFTSSPDEKAGDLLIRALRDCTAPFLLVAGGDVTADHPGTLHDLVAHLAIPGVGAVAPKVISQEGLVDHDGLALLPGGRIVFPFRGLGREKPGYGAYGIVPRNVAAVSPVLVAFRVTALREAGGFESGMSVFGMVIGACLALRQAGFRIVADGGTTIRLLDSFDVPADLHPGGSDFRQLTLQSPSLWTGGDPYCNINLRFDGEDIDLV